MIRLYAISSLNRVLKNPGAISCLAVLLSAISSGTVLAAKKIKVPAEFRGCWHSVQADPAAIPYELCFEDGQVETTVTLPHAGEAFVSTGLYRVIPSKLQLLGFPGEGWPWPSLVTCGYAFNPDATRLSFTDCALPKEWAKAQN